MHSLTLKYLKAPNMDLKAFKGTLTLKLKVLYFAATLTRGHKPNQSGDFAESMLISMKKHSEPIARDVYLLGTPDAATKLEYFITTTSVFLPAHA